MRNALLLSSILPLAAAQVSGSGSTTRYWDCCKPSCSWQGNVGGSVSGVVGTCSADDTPLSDTNASSGCEPGGQAFMCSSHAPWAVSEDLAYGWAAVRIAGGSEAGWCCACYELTFTEGPVAGKKMVVQATNTGEDLGDDHFDIAVSLSRFYILSGVPGHAPGLLGHPCCKREPVSVAPPGETAERFGHGIHFTPNLNTGLPSILSCTNLC